MSIMSTALIPMQRNRALARPVLGAPRLAPPPPGVDEGHLTAMFLHGRSANTRRSYQTALQDFLAFLGGPLAAADLEDVQTWADALQARGLSASTRRQRLSAVHSWYDFGLRLGALTADPTRAMRPPKGRDGLADRILSVAQVQALLAAARARIVHVPRHPAWVRQRDAAALLGASVSGIRFYARRLAWQQVWRRTEVGGVSCPCRFYHRDDIERLVYQGRAVRDYALLAFLYETGARISEALGLRWRDVAAQEEGTAAVTLFGKGAKTRTVGLRAQCVALLAHLRADAPPSGLIFRAVRGGYFPSNRPYLREHTCRLLHDLAAEAGLGLAVSAHWLRHSHASHALDAGCPIHVVKEQLGHASLTATERYLHTRPGVTSAAFLPPVG